ncbi:hypothetical protein [Sphingobium sp.]|uniref:hypothetical protein n=1 Tax=Sphingobium sp. TaxID=1912891 RepID=UPI0028BD43ED|nr:hypothetical protein [Sphingobium sp.]
MYQLSLRLAALVCAVASGSTVEARDTRPSQVTPVMMNRAEIRAAEGGFTIYTLSPSQDIRPPSVVVSVGSSVRIDKTILVQRKLPARNAAE